MFIGICCLFLAFLQPALVVDAIPTESVPLFSNTPKGIHKMPIRKVGNSSKLLTNGGLKHLEQIRARQKLMNQTLFFQQQSGLNGENIRSYSQHINNFKDQMYVAQFTFGTPPQEFTLMVDTEETLSWVVDKSCDSSQPCMYFCQKQDYCIAQCEDYCCDDYNPAAGDKSCACDKKHKFDQSMSKTYSKTKILFTDEFGDFNFADGFMGKDTLRFGGAKQADVLTVPAVQFGQATTTDRHERNNTIDGILSLGFDTFLNDPPLFIAIREGLLEKPMFTVFLEKKEDDTSNEADGMITYGGLDTHNCGPVQSWAPFVIKKHILKGYKFEMQGVRYGEKYRSNKKQNVLTLLGTSVIVGDEKIVRNLAKYAGATFSSKLGLYLIDCNADYEPITFKISGAEYNLPKEVLTLKLSDSQSTEIGNPHNKCAFGMQPFDFIPEVFNFSWIFGNPFIRQYCNIHDIGNKRMGFAPVIKPRD